MKIGALDHPKTLDLAARLNVALPTAIGHLELLWAYTAKHAPQGNVGKWPDGSIARACYWNADPTAFVTALAEAGFLDRDRDHRYLIHDWKDHAPRWVSSKLSRAGEVIFKCSPDSILDCSGECSPVSSDNSKARLGMARLGMGLGPTDLTGLPSKPPAKDQPPEFADFWRIFPKRAGDNPKGKTLRAIHARLAEGHTWDEILDGASRYAEFIRATGKERTEFVKQAATFCGPEKPFLDPWTPPATKADNRLESNLSAAAEFMRRTEAA